MSKVTSFVRNIQYQLTQLEKRRDIYLCQMKLSQICQHTQSKKRKDFLLHQVKLSQMHGFKRTILCLTCSKMSDLNGLHGSLNKTTFASQQIRQCHNATRGTRRWQRVHNANMKYTCELKTGKAVPAVKGEVLYGLKPCLMALKSARREFNALYVKWNINDTGSHRQDVVESILDLAQKQSLDVIFRSVDVLNTLSDYRTHQGFCLDASPLKCSNLSETELRFDRGSKPQIWVTFDEDVDPFNFGAIIRSCYVLGADRVIIPENMRQGSLTPIVSKSSSGVLEVLPIFTVPHFSNFLQACQKAEWDVVSVTQSRKDRASSPLYEFKVTRNTIMVVRPGYDNHSIQQWCSHLLYLPRRPGDSFGASLNISVTSGIILHHLTTSLLQSR